jgi:hypothetical protein
MWRIRQSLMLPGWFMMTDSFGLLLNVLTNWSRNNTKAPEPSPHSITYLERPSTMCQMVTGSRRRLPDISPRISSPAQIVITIDLRMSMIEQDVNKIDRELLRTGQNANEI